MGETTSAANGVTPNTADPTTVTVTPPATGEMPGTITAPSIDDVQKELAELKAALKKANAESASHRHKAKELDDLKAQAEASQLSETEKLQKKLTDMQAKLDETTKASQERVVTSEVRTQAAQLGFINPAVAAQLLNRSEIVFDGSGEPTNIGDLLKALLKENSYLAGKPVASTSGGATNPPRSASTTPTALSWDVISKLTQTEYNARGVEIKQWILNNPPRFR
jgi:hypothetical protein